MRWPSYTSNPAILCDGLQGSVFGEIREDVPVGGGTGVSAWANVDVAPGDREIAAIERLRESLGALPESALRVRELITRFEVCHFKRDEHYRNIKRSIAALCPAVEVDSIGEGYPGPGAQATEHGRIGTQYISALESWLGKVSSDSDRSRPTPIGAMPAMERQVGAWLGDRSDTKERLVRMLVARLRWDWDSMKKHQSKPDLEGLEYQIASTAICHYTFPRNLERVLEALGNLEPVETFEGCGTYCRKIEFACRLNYDELCGWLTGDADGESSELGTPEPTRAWLVACMAKTLKANVKLRMPLPDLARWMS